MTSSIGIVGAGRFRRFRQTLRPHPGISDIYFTDLITERAEEQSSILGATGTFDSFEAMLESDVDAVAIFTQRWLHGEMAIQALEAGKHVYSTVPMAIEADQIARIIELVKETGLTYMMGETSFYYPSSVYCRREARRG